MSAADGHTDSSRETPTRAGGGTPAAQPTPGMDVLSAVSEFESRVAAFKSLYAQSQAMQLEIEQRRSELAVKESELAQRSERAAAHEQELIRLDAELVARKAEADAAMAAAEQLRAELKVQADETAALFEKRHAEVDARAMEVAASEGKLQELRATLDERDQKVAERERKAAQTEETAKKIREAEHALSQRIAELNKRQQQLKDESAQLAEARRQAAEQIGAVEHDRALLAEQQRDAEMQAQAIAADRMALEALEREATEENARLAALRAELEAKAAQLADRDARLAEDQSRASSDRSEKAARTAADLAAAREELSRERAAHAELLSVVEEYEQLWLLELRESARLATIPVPSVAAPAAAEADANELQELVAGLKDRLRTEITTARTLREELEHARSERDAAIKQAERVLAKRGAGAAVAPSQPVTRTPAIESLERRRRRLKVLRELLRKQALRIRKAGEALKKRYEQVDQILAQRAELAGARNRIIEAEKRIAKSKAASRAAVIVLCGVGVFSLVGALSWAVAREIAPATFEAVAIVKAEGRDRELSPAELHEWQTFHEELLADPRFHEAAADRFKRQGNAPLAAAGGVSELITNRVTTESLGDGELRLRMTGIGAEPTARTLETLTAGFMAYANSGHGKRLDGGVTVASQPATAGAAPIDQVRTTYALGMMSVGVTVSLGIAAFLWRRLSGVKTAFEQDAQLSGALDETRWTGVDPS